MALEDAFKKLTATHKVIWQSVLEAFLHLLWTSERTHKNVLYHGP